MKAYLVDIYSAEDNSFVATVTKGVYSWIGYNDIASEGHFVWDNTGAKSSYTNWAHSEPNDLNGEDCAQMWNNHTWRDTSCQTYSASVCKKSKICKSNLFSLFTLAFL